MQTGRPRPGEACADAAAPSNKATARTMCFITIPHCVRPVPREVFGPYRFFLTILRPQRSEGARNDAARDDLRLAEPAYSGLWQRAKRQTQKILSRVSKHFKAGFEE